MKHFFRSVLAAVILIITGLSLYPQTTIKTFQPDPVALAPEQLFPMTSIPPLTVPENYRGPDAPLLPYWIDNSTQPYFRSITTQSGYECGQSAGIAFNFTYEIDRLRGIPANTSNNLYPTHFSWDFLNNGDNYTGASCFDSWEIVRTCGNMNVTDYGGALNTGGYKRWISGYNIYYNGMANRINYMRSIRVDSPEGLQTLKYWLYDHLEGSSVGGVANFYGNYFSPTKVLPPGTPEAGKYVQTYWGASPSHTWTVCGYNDSIRYDYNGDGLYTNNIDINSDGIVDMHDWEIGGLKFASGYAGTGWSNGGFCYLMYKTLADAISYGGIWNHTVYVINTKQTCSPKLTLKITLKHNSRNKIKVNAGFSTNLSATTPSVVLDFPIFNFQGGDYYMQGGTTEADKTIEFGLDLTPLLSDLSPGQPAKWFLQVQEKDPSGTYDGEIVSWSLIDYTSGTPAETSYPTGNVAILNNTITRLSLNYTVGFSKPAVTTASLPAAILYQPYSFPLAANGGTSPYLWDARLTYPETVSSATLPAPSGQQLTLTNNNNGYAIKTLPFEFPFYKRTVSKLYIYADGYILFDDQPFTWPFLIDRALLFKYTSVISPFNSDLCIYPSQGQGIWYKEEANSVTISWKESVYNMSTGSSLNYAVKLYTDGKIEFCYGTMNFPNTLVWIGGISGGDNKNFQFSSLNGSTAITANTLDQFAACNYPVEMTLSEDGIFSGTPVHPYQNVPVTFSVTDNNNITSLKTLSFFTNGILVNYTVNSGGDSIIEYGETANISLTLNNIGSSAIHNINLTVSESDPFITLTDSTEFAGTLNPGQVVNIPNAFSFSVSPYIPDDHHFQVVLHFSSQEQNYQRPLFLTGYAPEIHAGYIILNDGDNGQLDPGETADLLVTFENKGGAKAAGINVDLSTTDPLVILNTSSGSLGLLNPDSAKTITFNVTGTSNVPYQHIYLIDAHISAANSYSATDSIYLFSGEIIEDFETGNFNKFNWYFGGFAPWSTTPQEHYEGFYSARSGWIYDNMESSVDLNVHVLANGFISFWKKVSCEHDPSGYKNYDYLAFFIDNNEMGRWDGLIDWSKEIFPVTEGYHIFRWVYHKDYSVSTYSDCSWIDFITFPLIEGALPGLSAYPLSFTKDLETGQTATDTLIITNTGGTLLDFSVIVFDTTVSKENFPTDNLAGSYMECYTDGFVPGQSFSWTFALHNQSPDNEYVRHVKMDFPPGATVNTATNFSGGSLGELAFLGTPGNGASLEWHGESSGNRGVVKPGETAASLITGTIPTNFPRDVFAVYSIRGDSTGSPLHAAPGYVRLTNFGLANSWISLTNFYGQLFKNQSDTVILNFNTSSLAAGDYFCYLIARDLYNNQLMIPVDVHITDPVNKVITPGSNGFGLSVSPNPFSGSVSIRYMTAVPQNVRILITDAMGKTVRVLADRFHPPGTFEITWDGTYSIGRMASPGIYFCRLMTDSSAETVKLVRVR